jgi:hypothetical protein
VWLKIRLGPLAVMQGNVRFPRMNGISHTLGCIVTVPDYWNWNAIAGWAVILAGVAVGISYFYAYAILLGQSTAS